MYFTHYNLPVCQRFGQEIIGENVSNVLAISVRTLITVLTLKSACGSTNSADPRLGRVVFKTFFLLLDCTFPFPWRSRSAAACSAAAAVSPVFAVRKKGEMEGCMVEKQKEEKTRKGVVPPVSLS